MRDKLKFVLINPTAAEWQVTDRRKPRRSTRAFRFSMLPSLYVAAAMPEWVETRIVDEDVEPIDFNTDADFIGISFMTFNAPRAYAVADAFRARGKPVIVGGYHPTFLPQEAAEHADAVCVGEAETTIPRLMEDFARGDLQKIYHSDSADLAGLPIPDRSLIRKSAYITSNGIQATRGCPHGCTFCSVAAFHRQKHRTRPAEEVIEELKQLGRYVLFLDDSIAANRAYALELFEKMIPLQKRWFSQCGIGIADDPELLSVAARSGCRGLFVGFESLSDDTLRANHKPRNMAAEYVSAVKRIHDAGIGVFGGFVFGWDDDTPEVFGKTLQFLHEARIDLLQATILTPFPGTPLFAQMERDGRIRSRDWRLYDFGHTVFEPARMSAETLRNGHRWVLSQFYSSRRIAGRLVRGLGYLDLETFFTAGLTLNFGYRSRLGAKNVFREGRRFQEVARSGG